MARWVNQSETLKDFSEISTRLGVFIADLSLEKTISQKIVYRTSLDQSHPLRKVERGLESQRDSILMGCF